MNNKEKELVNEDFISMTNNYNICIGGKGGWSYVNQNKLNIYGENRKNFIIACLKGRKTIEYLRKIIQNGKINRIMLSKLQ